MLPRNFRVYKGTETSTMTTMHEVMDDPKDSIIYGSSTSNKIERWWRDLHERLEKFFKKQLTALLRQREYDPLNALERQRLCTNYSM